MFTRINRTGKGISALMGLAAGWTLAASSAGAQSAEETAITIYSTAQPGAVSPDLYRPVPGQGTHRGQAVPGYAMIRHMRNVDLADGLNRLNFTDVAAYIDPTTVSVARRLKLSANLCTLSLLLLSEGDPYEPMGAPSKM